MTLPRSSAGNWSEMHKITKHIANVYDGDDFEDLKHLAADCFGHPIVSKGRD